MIFQNIKMALISIKSAKMRSFLTMLGIIIGVASVVTIIAVGEGVKSSVRSQVTSFGTNLVQINPGQAIDDSDNNDGASGGFNFASTLGASTLTEKDLIVVKETTGVESSAPLMFISGILGAGSNTAKQAYIVATTPQLKDTINQQIASGSFLTDSDMNQPVIVIGSNVAKSLFGTQDAVGKTVTLRNQQLTVVGVMQDLGTGVNFGPSLNDATYIGLDYGKSLAGGAVNIYEIDVKVASDQDVNKVVGTLKERLKASHNGTTDFTVTTAEDQLKVFDQIFSILTSFVAAIAAISLIVGGIGIMNIMLVTVAERTREIGIRKAIGATSGNILTQFLIEAIILSVFGGLLGLGLSYVLAQIVKKAASITPIFTYEAFVLAFGVSLLVGIVFGVAPAIKAARKKPIQALKSL